MSAANNGSLAWNQCDSAFLLFPGSHREKRLLQELHSEKNFCFLQRIPHTVWPRIAKGL